MMLFGEREDDFPEIDLLDNHSKKTEDMSKFETIIGARNAVTGNIEGASPICINGKAKQSDYHIRFSMQF